MENKSNCCQTVYGQCDICGQSLTNGHKCLLVSTETQKKNSGLTLSEIAADEDVLEFKRPFHPLPYLATSRYDMIKEYLAATDWVVTKRKSDGGRELKSEYCINVSCNKCVENETLKHRCEKLLKQAETFEQENIELQKENAELSIRIVNLEASIKEWKDKCEELYAKRKMYLEEIKSQGEVLNKIRELL